MRSSAQGSSRSAPRVTVKITSESNIVKALIRLADRRGLLKGDLNALQLEALQWLVIDEQESEAEIFETNLRFLVLSNNPQLYQHIWPDEDEGVEWRTPQSEEEIEALISEIESNLTNETSLHRTHPGDANVGAG
jgi:hypothetical protein